MSDVDPRRRAVHPTRRDHGHAARARRLPVGPRADDRHAEAVRARGNLRGARGDRPPRPRGALRGARRLPVRGGLPRAARGRGRALHHRRLARRASPTSWCGATRTSSRATAGEAALDSAGPGAGAVGGDQGAGARRQREAEDAAQRHRRRRCPRCCARTRSARARRRSASTGARPATSSTRSRKRSTSCARWSRRRARSIRRAPRRRWATCSSPSRTSRASSASSRRPRCARRTTSSRSASGRLEQAVADSGRAMKDMTLDELEAEWQRLKSPTPS